MGTEESKKIWEENAQFWDNAMGDESNEFHREVVRPKVTELLSPNPADYILDIACGNGNYSSYLAQRGASVVAFDYSKKMIELAKRRQSQYAKQIEFCVADGSSLHGLIDPNGNVILPCKFHAAWCGISYENKFVVVEGEDKKKGLQDFDGNTILPTEYSEIYWRSGPLLIVRIGENGHQKYGLIAHDGTEILPTEYEGISHFAGDKYVCKINGCCEVLQLTIK